MDDRTTVKRDLRTVQRARIEAELRKQHPPHIRAYWLRMRDKLEGRDA